MADPHDDRSAGNLSDDHPLSAMARAYGESVLRGGEWPLSAIDPTKVAWATSTRARRKNGYCRYESAGYCTVTVGAHVYERAGFDACRETIRHELVHAWQHQHAGERAVCTDDGPRVVGAESAPEGRTIVISPGHGPSFRAWVDPLGLSGRCSTPYERTRGDFTYVFECPSCGDWWGRHRLCPSVRQAAHGRVGSAGYRYCADCGSLVHLRSDGRYLEHGPHDDEAIRAFVAGETGSVPTTDADGLAPAMRPAADD